MTSSKSILALLSAVACLLWPGSVLASASGPDPTFGIDGRAGVSEIPTFDSGVEALAAGAGSIYITSLRGTLIRLNQDGQMVPTFGGNGLALTAPFESWLDRLYAPALEVQKDGKVLAAGSRGEIPFLSRLTVEGEFDPGFADGGSTLDRSIRYLGQNRHLNDIEIDAKGRILVSGLLYRRFKGDRVVWGFVTRFRKNGKIDRSFGKRGRVLYRGIKSPGVIFQSVEITKRGRIVVLRQNTKGTSAIALDPTGKRDPRFAKGRGYLRLPWAGTLESLPGGRLYAFGIRVRETTGELANGCARIFAFSSKGKLRSSFSGDGVRHVCPENLGRMFSSFEGESPTGILDSGFTVQGDGKPVFSLALTGVGILGQPTIRFTPDGQVDRSFADQGLFRAQEPLGRPVLGGLPSGVLVNAGTLIAGDPLERPYKYDDYIYRFGP